jgi:cysteine desulfurase/selenocysteine lyase
MYPDWDVIREEFPALRRGIIHLDTATFGQVATRTMIAVMQHFSRRDQTACRDFLAWFDDVDRTRVSLSQLINSSSDDIAFVTNAAGALSMLLSGIEWREGDEVIALEHEFPNNLYAPSALARRGVVFRECAWADLDATLNDRTRLVLLSTVNYTTGFRPPLSGLGERLRKRGVLLYVDGTQSIGALQFDVADVQPSVLAVHGYKWMLCPNGSAFAYISPDTRAWLEPNVIGWRSHRDWRNVDNLHHGRPELPARAEKYEGGMLPFALIGAMDAAVNMYFEIGPKYIERRILKLAAEVRDTFERLGAKVADHESNIVTASFRNMDAVHVKQGLERQNVFVSARRGLLRVSPHYYNNLDDVVTFEAALRRALAG